MTPADAVPRRRGTRLVLGVLLGGLAVALLAAAGARWELGRARRSFDATASETVDAWAARHGKRDEDDRARRLLALVADLREPRPGDPVPAVKGTAAHAWFMTMTHVGAARRAIDAGPLPAPAPLRAWMDARAAELDALAGLLAEAPPSWGVGAAEARSADRRRLPLVSQAELLLARALDDSARGLGDRADLDLRAAWSLQESWTRLPRHPEHPDDDLLACMRVGQPPPADWLVRLAAARPRAELHEAIVARAAAMPQRVAQSRPGDLPRWMPRALAGAKLPFVRALREAAAARALRKLAVVDAAVAGLPRCGDVLSQAPLLVDAWIAEEMPLGLADDVDRRLVVRTRAAEVDLALTRRVLELRAGVAQPGDPCAGTWLVETPAEDGVTVAWRGDLPSGMEGWAGWFPGPFTVRGAARAGRAAGAGP